MDGWMEEGSLELEKDDKMEIEEEKQKRLGENNTIVSCIL